MAYNMALHRAAQIVQFLDYEMVAQTDSDGHGYVTMDTLDVLGGFLNVPKGFQYTSDDIAAMVDCLPSWLEVEDLTDDYLEVVDPEKVFELWSEIDPS